MKVLMLSRDQDIAKPGTHVRKRMEEYGELFSELHILVIGQGERRPTERIRDNVYVYALGGKTFVASLIRAYMLGKRVLQNSRAWIITAQDPFETGAIAHALKKHAPNTTLNLQAHTDFLSKYFSLESFVNKVRVLIASRLIVRADTIRVVSQRIKRSLIDRYSLSEKNISILPIFVDTRELMETDIKTDLRKRYGNYDHILLIASRLSKEKNIPLAIRALGKIIREVPRTLLLIVGDGPELANLKATAQSLGLESNVVFEPWTDDLGSYYKTTDLFLLTSNYEGYGRTVIEARAAGATVVMTDVGVARSFADERVHVLPIGDIDSFAKEITSLLKQEKKREKADHSASKEVYRKAYVDSLKAKREKLCYVLPRYDKNDDTHFSYLPEFIGSFSAHNDVHIVIERGELPEREVFPNASVSLVRGSGLFRMLQIKWRLMQARASGYRDFYVHYSFFSAYVASVLVRVFGGRVFYWNCGEPWKYRRSFLREGFERLTYKLITYLVTGTETMKKAYGEHYGLSLEKIKVLPNWIDLGVTEKYKEDEVRRKLLIPPHAKIILFVHRISKRKGAHHLPEILKGLTDKNVVLLIVGTGPEQGRVESLMGQYGLGERVRFLGSVPHKDIARYFAAADIFLMPSEEEGFPHVLLESMAFGVPFVASRVGGVSDIVPESAKQFLVPPGDIMGYTDALRALLGESEKKHNERVKDLTSWVLRYDISTVESLFETLFW